MNKMNRNDASIRLTILKMKIWKRQVAFPSVCISAVNALHTFLFRSSELVVQNVLFHTDIGYKVSNLWGYKILFFRLL